MFQVRAWDRLLRGEYEEGKMYLRETVGKRAGH